MPITLRPNDVNYKDGNSYKTMNVIADQKTSEKIAAIEAAASAEVTKITEKGTETRNSIPDDYTALSDQVVGLKSDKVDKPKTDDNGKMARAKNGDVEWVSAGQPTDAQTMSAVRAWLDEHPEATTTVPDDSLTIKKIVEGTLGYVTPEKYGATNGENALTAFVSAIETGLPVICNGNYLLHSDNHIYIDKPIWIVGNGSITFDFHITCPKNVKVEGITLISKNVTTGLFNVLGNASYISCTFGGTSNSGLDGAIAAIGANLYVDDCVFNGTCVNIVANTKVIITRSVFDAENKNTLPNNVSNEPLHLQKCGSALIESCTFRRSKQDYIDFYPGAQSVIVKGCLFEENDTSYFEIKNVLRDAGDPAGGNIVYDVDNGNIRFECNRFVGFSAGVFTVGLTADNRSDKSSDTEYHTRNIVVENNIFETEKSSASIASITNVRGFVFMRNTIISNGQIRLVSTGKKADFSDVGYAIKNYNIVIDQNVIKKCNGVTLLQQSCDIDATIRGNVIEEAGTGELYAIAINNGPHNESNITIADNYVLPGSMLRIATQAQPITGRCVLIRNQDFRTMYIGACKSIEISKIEFGASAYFQSFGNIGSMRIKDCVYPGFTGEYTIENVFVTGCVNKPNTSILAANPSTINNLCTNGNVGNVVTGSNVVVSHHD